VFQNLKANPNFLKLEACSQLGICVWRVSGRAVPESSFSLAFPTPTHYQSTSTNTCWLTVLSTLVTSCRPSTSFH